MTIEKVYGSAELNSVGAGAVSATISSEFPVPLTDGSANGGIYLFKLNAPTPGLLCECGMMCVYEMYCVRCEMCEM